MYKIFLLFLIFQCYEEAIAVTDNPQPDDVARVVGGTAAPEGKYPYQVSLRNNSNAHFCGGSIMNHRWILTAAHCIENAPINSFFVVVGTNRLDRGGSRYLVEKVINQKFERRTFKNDVSVIKVTKDIVFSKRIRSIQLTNKDTGAGKNVLLTGWGYTSYPGKPPNQMQMINLTTLTVDRCKRLQNSFPVDASNLCTFTKAGEGGCYGDSGGPLVEGNFQVGIVSWGNLCAVGRPDVYARVFYYRDWINNKIKKT